MTSHSAVRNGRRRASARPGDQPVGRVRGEVSVPENRERALRRVPARITTTHGWHRWCTAGAQRADAASCPRGVRRRGVRAGGLGVRRRACPGARRGGRARRPRRRCAPKASRRARLAHRRASMEGGDEQTADLACRAGCGRSGDTGAGSRDVPRHGGHRKTPQRHSGPGRGTAGPGTAPRLDSRWKAAAAHRRTGIGALLGHATGTGVALVYALLRGRTGSIPTPLAGVALAIAAMAVGDLPPILSGTTDPRRWGARGWLSDLVPHLVYGLVTAGAYDMTTTGR